MNIKNLNKILLVTGLVCGIGVGTVNASSENNWKSDINQMVNIESKIFPTSDEKCLQKANGSYFSQLLAKNNGKRDKEFQSPSIYDITKYADVLVVKGTLDYNKDPESTNVDKMLANKAHFFTTSNNTIYKVVGASINPEIYSEDEFLKHYNQIKYLGYAINIEVKDGFVTSITIYE
ncbi:MAG: hypothetical protein E7L45_00075 [Peptoniphilus lacydonensis]|uniref:hypothetical protein n=1 Tax=Peptoniphilus lacydonensis TaxID=1673725 RepID=UPI002585B6B6|nr:hypothetical protein [Peptoniphilus lacydonensis]MDU2115631.1 hypothetical protein [Peptoniphilus lacydonensis]MDU7301687.1 hypothetical protein [Peptoniphilus lacydonensis]